MILSQRIGDTVTHRTPLRWSNRAFDPTDWTLTFTVKSDPDTQADAAASFQKTTGGGGITVTGTNASVEVLPEDTNDLTAGTYYWDIQATDDISGEIRTVAGGTMVLTRDVTREPGVTLDVVTVSPPLLYFSYQDYLEATTDPTPLTEEEWVMVTLTGAITSETAPENTQYPWFDPEYGIMSHWNGNAWVVTSTTQGAPGSATNIVTTTTNPSSGSSITGVPDLDETHYVNKTTIGAIAALTWELPSAADSRVGQMKVFYCNRNVTALTVSVSDGGALAGLGLTAAVANEAYSYQCVSVSGTGTWLRLA